MSKNMTHPVLQKAIKMLDASKEFKAMARANGYRKLQDILDLPVYQLPYKPKSGYRMLKEFLDIMDSHGIINLIPGYDE